MLPSTAEMKKTYAIKPRQTMRGHTSHVNGVVHLPNGRSIITCSHDSSLRRWDLESGAQTGDDWRDEGDEAAVWCIALSPNSKTIASGSSEGTVTLWNVEKEKVIAKWAGHTMIVRSLCWSADSEYVVSGSYDGMARVWNVKSGKTVLGPIKVHEHVFAVAYSPDMKNIATGGQNENAVKIWDSKTGELLFTLKHEDWVSSLVWTSNQKKLISGSYGLIRTFDTVTWQQIAILEAHNYVYALSLFRNDRLLASAASDRTARLWDLDTNFPVGPPLQHEHEVYCAAFSADGKELVTGCINIDENEPEHEQHKNVYAWDIHTTLTESGHEDLLPVPHVTSNALEHEIACTKAMDSDATRHRHPVRLQHTRLPQGFFDGAPDNVHSSGTHRRCALSPSPSSSSHLHDFLGRFSSHFHHPQATTGESTEPQQPQMQHISSHPVPHIIEVAPVRDRQALYVAPRRERLSDWVKRIKNPTWWTRCVLFICCVSVPSANTNGHQEST